MAGLMSVKRKAEDNEGVSTKKGKQPAAALPKPSSALYDDPMIDPTDSSGSDNDEEVSGVDGGDDDVDEIGGDGEEDEEEDEFAHVPEAGPSRPRQKNLYAPPTLEEMDRLRSARETGNTFTLQLEALLSATLLPTTPPPKLKSLLSKIHDLILALPSLAALTPRQALERTSDIPFAGGDMWSPLKKDVQWTLGWSKPAEVFVGGSWSVCGGYKKGKGVMGDVDLVVVMPSDMFSPKDRMNYRYFHKRAHYLAVIKAAIQKAMLQDEEMKDLEVVWNQEDTMRPIVVLRAGKSQDLKYAVDIKIHASAPPNAFPTNTISPFKNLLRIDDDLLPTPVYATSLAHDTLQKSHLLNLHHLSQLLPDRQVDSFLALWRIWASRRNLSQGTTGWFAGMLLSWVVEGGEQGGQGGVRERTKISRGLGRGLGYWGALRAAWEFLAHTDFNKTPIFMGGGEDSIISPTEFCRASSQVFVDPSRSVNIFADWEEGEVDLLRHHARETLAMLEDHSADRFAEVFLRSVGGTSVFDEFIRVDISESAYTPSAIAQSEQPSRIHLIAHAAANVLRKGLTNRGKLVHVQPRGDHLDIGIIYDSEYATKVMDMGPSPDQPTEVAAFRALWGDKAELRRFKDGSIAESVVWDLSRPEDAALIPGWIVDWLVRRHFGITSSDHISSNPSWITSVQTPSSARNAIAIAGSEKLGFSPIMKAYDELYRLLKSIDPELPLAILNVSPSDEMLRYSSTFIPHPVDINRFSSTPDCVKYTPSAEVIVQFETSAKWPDDLAAIQKVKLALLEKLARIASAQLKGAKANIVFESETSEIQDHAGLEIFLPSGVAFMLRIHYDKERTQLERILTEDAPIFGTSLPRPSRRLAQPALESYMRRFVHRLAHHSALAPMHHRYPSYSSATRLLKRWFAAHMLSLQVRSEAIELLMAAVYLDPLALSIPASATTGFIRAIERLAGWDWKAEPIFVPVFTAAREAANHSTRTRLRFPAELRVEAMRLFGQRRANDPEVNHGAWGIVTEDDVEGWRWTKDGPSRVIAGRVGILARATADVIRQADAGAGLNVKSLFKTPLHQYDILLHLRPAFLARYSQAIEPMSREWEDKLKFRNLQDGGIYGSEVKVDFDPAWSFVTDIQRIYGDSILVFFDRHGGTTIGLLFNPVRKVSRSFKPFLGYSARPVQSDSALVELDTEAVLAEITRMGEGLIERVERGMGI